MKLNLLPQTEKGSRQGKTAWILATLIVLGSIAGYGMLTYFPLAKLNVAKDSINGLPQQVADADALAKSADTIIANAGNVIRNAKLAQAMIDHNDVYPKLYDDIKQYIPPYYRLQTIQAASAGAGMSTITLTGTLSGYQKYADLMLALMRFKDAVTITRSGYNLNDPTVPGLQNNDQVGKMRKPGEEAIPDDPLERMAYFQAQAAAAPKGYLNTGYGSGATDEARGPLPDASVVTIQMQVARDLRVPLATETLRQSAGAAGGAGAAPGLAAPGGLGGPSGPPGMNGGPSGPPGMPGGGRGRQD